LVVGGVDLDLAVDAMIGRLLLAIFIIDHDHRSRSTIRGRSAAESASVLIS
jgi:hypothetical protein